MAKSPKWVLCGGLSALLASAYVDAVSAASQPHAVAAIDVASGRILVERDVDLRLRPASLAKLMTLHLVFAAIDDKRLGLTDQVTVSAHAATRPPVRVGFEVGQNVSVEELLLATILRSANDAAAALGEAVAGSEAEFARQMNARAQTLGLRNTRFANASGLPSTAAYTTARDMAHLALQMLEKQRHWLPLFSRRKATVAGKTLRGYNRWLSDFSGATGLKTGFTCRAGYHLAALSTRGGRETLTIVLGAPTQQIRFQSALRATNQALGRTPEPYPKLDPTVRPDSRPVPTVLRAEACAAPASGVGGRGPSRWSIVFEVFVGAPEARARARQFRRLYARGGRLYLVPRYTTKIVYQAGLTGLTQKMATSACLRARADGDFCIVQQPTTGKMLWQRAQRSLKSQQKSGG